MEIFEYAHVKNLVMQDGVKIIEFSSICSC